MTDLRKAAEMALEALETLNSGDTYKTHNAAAALRQALTQPEQEQYVTKVVAMHEDGTYTTERIPLPKREWVGLTRKEAEDVVDDFITIGGDVENWVGYWQAIEAKLKEKNSG